MGFHVSLGVPRSSMPGACAITVKARKALAAQQPVSSHMKKPDACKEDITRPGNG